MTRIEILESRCWRFKNVIKHLLDISSLNMAYISTTGYLTPNDMRYLLDMEERENKPPLGIEPEYIWMQRRVDDLQAAIERYAAAKMVIPIEWVREQNELISTLHEGGYW